MEHPRSAPRYPLKGTMPVTRQSRFHGISGMGPSAPANPLVARVLCLVGLVLLVATAQANELVKRPDVDTSALPAIAPGWADVNPLRGNAEAARIGGQAFSQTCARCHGDNANGSRSPAPDLRRIGLACKRVKDPLLNQRCQADADHFFVKSVRYGKQKFGIVHMPPWDSVLEPALVWSLRSFVETAPRD